MLALDSIVIFLYLTLQLRSYYDYFDDICMFVALLTLHNVKYEPNSFTCDSVMQLAFIYFMIVSDTVYEAELITKRWMM